MMADKVEPVAEFWRKNGWDVTLQATERPGHAIELARQAAARGEDLVLAVGGDGTMGQIADGLAGSRTVMAPLPIGTSNALARELKLPRPQLLDSNAPIEASEALMAGRVQRIDLTYIASGKENGHALLWTGIGADGYLVQQIEPRPDWSKRLGPIGYSIQALFALPRLPKMHAVVEVDDQRFEEDLLLIIISTTRLYAGGLIELSPAARFDDGLFEVWLFQTDELANWLEPSRASLMARYMAEVQFNLQGHDPGVTMVTGKRVVIETRPKMPCHTDGEWAGYTPLTCEIRPQALNLLVPPSAPADLFIEPGVPFDEIF